MDITTALIGLLVVALILIPFIAMGRKSGRNARELGSLLRDFAATHDGNITRMDYVRNMALGLDERERVLYFLKRTAEGNQTRRIDLNHVRDCRVVQTRRTVRQGGVADSFIESLRLAFSLAAVKQPDDIIELYNADETMQVTSELQLANKWASLVNDLVTSRSGAHVS